MKSHTAIPEIPRERKFIRNKKWVRSDTIPNEIANKKWIRAKVIQNEAANGSRSLSISSSFSEGTVVAQQRSTEQQQPALKRAGKHKLILPSTTTNTTGGYGSTVTATSSNSMVTSKNRKRRQPPSMCTINLVVKRIPLNDNTTPSGDTTSSSNVRNPASPPPNGAQHDVDKLLPSNTNVANPNSRLTDFAYRCLPAAATTTTTLRSHDATGQSSNLSYNRGRDSNKVIQSKTAQLIRVKPGEDPQQVFVIGTMKKQASPRSATAQSVTSIPTGKYKFIRNQLVPSYNRTATLALQHKSEHPTTSQICPEVMSGKECSNVYCTKRHDIPRTMATPICTFFQRHGGQCHKGDSCRFLHVKLNPQAEICSVFQIYGHCSAGESCPRKHIRASHPNTNNSLKNDSRTVNIQGDFI
jgi:hypothetical protein